MSFDPQAATAAYIDSLGADALAGATAYTTGGHWLLLWNLLVSALVVMSKQAIAGHEIGHYVLGHVWRTVNLLSVLVFMVSLFLLFAQPLLNGRIRTGGNEADQYSLETVNLPDALATALVKTAEYANPRRDKLEELLFYTHPSVERRVRRAMDWKASRPQ